MRGLLKKISFALIACFVVVFALQADAADLDDLYKRRDQLSDQLEKAESSSKAKQQEVRSLTQQISSLENDIKATESKITQTTDQISSTESEIKNLDSQIKQKTNELNELKKKINASIVEIYRFSSRSDWELVLSSSSLGESSNQAKYVEAIQIQVKSMYDKLLKLKEALDGEKSKLEAKREELNNLRQRQEEYKKGAEYQVAQKDKLKNMTEQQKVEYERMAEKIRNEYAAVDESIRRILLENVRGSFDSRSSTLGYPWANAVKDSYPDDYGFWVRECTSYVAWRWNASGREWNRRKWPEFDQCGGGHAKYWACVARKRGMTVGSSPVSGSIAVWTFGDCGHVAYVESVNGDQMTISDYNAVPPFGGMGNIRTISVYGSSFGPAEYIYP